MTSEDYWVVHESRIDLGWSGNPEAEYGFSVYAAPTEKPFLFSYFQGRNHWESDVAEASLAQVAANPQRYFDHLIEACCAWAIPIFEAGFADQDTEKTVRRLIEWGKSMQDMTYE